MEKFSHRTYKKKIIETIRPHIILNEGKDWSDEKYEEYFLTEYQAPKTFSYDESNFFTYKVGKYIWIQDFVTDSRLKSVKMLKDIKCLQNEFKKDVRCQVALTNIKVINALIRSGFKIINLIGYNYILQERYKHGRKKS